MLSIEAVEMSWVPGCGRVAIRNSRQDQPGDPCVYFVPAAMEAFIGRVRAGDYGTGTVPPPRTVPLGAVLGDRRILKRPGRGGHRATQTARRAPAGHQKVPRRRTPWTLRGASPVAAFPMATVSRSPRGAGRAAAITVNASRSVTARP